MTNAESPPVSFLPFPTRLFADFIQRDSPERAAVIGYFAIAVFFIIPFRHVRPALRFWRQARRPSRP